MSLVSSEGPSPSPQSMEAGIVVHESERQRQHARFQIPACMRMGSEDLSVPDWSVGGCRGEGFDTPPEVGSTSDLTLQFAIDAVALSLPLRARCEWSDSDGRAGFTWVGLRADQRNVLLRIIDSYLEGELVGVGEIFQLLRADQYGAPRKQEIAKEETPFREKIIRGIRVAGLLSVLLVAGVVIGNNIYNHLFRVETTRGFVGAHVVQVRMPETSFFEPVGHEIGTVLRVGEEIATATSPSGISWVLTSPCECEVIGIHALNNEVVPSGQPVLSLLPSGSRTFIRAEISEDDTRHVALGDRVQVRVGEGEEQRGIVEEIRGRFWIPGHPSAQRSGASEDGRAEVIIATTATLSPDLIGRAATATIDTSTRIESAEWLRTLFAGRLP